MTRLKGMARMARMNEGCFTQPTMQLRKEGGNTPQEHSKRVHEQVTHVDWRRGENNDSGDGTHFGPQDHIHEFG
jgi:hypothetical protein